MTTKYIDVSDVELQLGVTFTTTSTPTLNQVTDYISQAEKDFEDECGVYAETSDVTEYIIPTMYGLKVNTLPLTDITSVSSSNGDRITPTFTIITSTDYRQDDDLIMLRNVIKDREYKVIYDAGYAKADMPSYIKYTVVLYTCSYIFNKHLFETNGSSSEETIDAEVYKLVTKDSAYNGTSAFDMLLNKQKAKFGKRIFTTQAKRLQPSYSDNPYR